MKPLMMLAVTDIYATKGIEYLLCIGFLLLLVPFWTMLSRPVYAAGRAVHAAVQRSLAGWFSVPDGVHFHRGHTWAVPEGADVVRVGLDDFAYKLVGRPGRIVLPEPGARLEQGERGWRLEADSKSIDMLAPVRGEVLAVNHAVLASPDILDRDPYGQGWLLRVRVPNPDAAVKNLLSGKLASAWMEETAGRLERRMSASDFGTTLADGGVPRPGFARELSPDRWDEIAAEYFLTD